MKIPLSWLSEFLGPLHQKEVAERLTLLGIEVEKIEETPLAFSGVVVGKVLSAARHPNAERLQVAAVTDGTEEYQVVCGAPNCRAGIKVAFAKIGASLKDPEGKHSKIKKGKLRDVESFGMLCSSKELGLGIDEDGIIELPENWALGADLSIFYSDPVLEIALTPNLGHCMSVIGLARELGASFNRKVQKPAFSLKEESSFPFKIVVEDQEKCLRYASRLIEGVTVGPSPDWLRKRLEACGLRSINNIVDITNYVMMELGQPLHAFDADKIADQKIIVSSSTSAGQITTLDEKNREIPVGTLLICDPKHPLAIAGVMGGLDSAAKERTKNLLLEAALFAPPAIRKAAKRMDLKTDSSARFERGIDPNNVVFALDRAAFLIQQMAGGKVSSLFDFKKENFLPKKLVLGLSKMNELLGTHLSLSEAVEALVRLEMEVSTSNDLLHVTVPTYRNDISIQADLVEEVARIYGYNNLPHPTPLYPTSTIPHAPIYIFEQEVRRFLLQQGLQECMTCDLIGPELAKLTEEKGLGPESLISVLHPRSIDQSVLRASLLPGLLQVAQHNFSRQEYDLSLFEVGRIHFKAGEEHKEQSCAGILLTGKDRPHHFDRKSEDVDFLDLKGVIENLIPQAIFEPAHLQTLHPGRQAQVKIGEEVVGVFGEVHPRLAKALDLLKPLFFAQLNLHDLFRFKKREKKISPLPAFPGSERDWTLSLKEELPIEAAFQAIASCKSRLLESFFLLDLYKSEKIGKDRKNATFRFIYRDLNKTIEIETVDREHQRLTQFVAEKLKDGLV